MASKNLNIKKILKMTIFISFLICIIFSTMPVYAEDKCEIWCEKEQNIVYKKAYIPHHALEIAVNDEQGKKIFHTFFLGAIASAAVGSVILPAVGVTGPFASMVSVAFDFGFSYIPFETRTEEWLRRSIEKGDTGVTVTFLWSDPQDILVHKQCTKLSLTHPWMDCRGKGWKYVGAE